jgi:hypothetical protein
MAYQITWPLAGVPRGVHAELFPLRPYPMTEPFTTPTQAGEVMIS